MLINNTDIKTFKAKLLKVNIGSSEILNNSEWVKGNINPLILRNNIGFKELELELLIKGASRNEVNLNISNLKSTLNDQVTIVLENYNNSYTGILNEIDIKKSKSKVAYIVTLIFLCYESDKEVIEIINRITSKTINVAGNSKTPCVVEITPISDIIDLTLSGFAEDPIIIKNLKGNKKVVLDGDLQTVTVDGINKYGDTDMWDFPRLIACINTIAISRNSCDIKIKYKPRFE